MLEHVQAKNSVELSGHRRGKHIVNETVHRPGRIKTSLSVGDEHRVKIDRSDSPDLLLYQSGAEGVGATNFEHALASAQHFGDKLVTRQRE